MLFLLVVIAQCESKHTGGSSSQSSGSSTKCDMCGGSSSYSEVIETTTTVISPLDADNTASVPSVVQRKIIASGCPNHYSACTGKVGPSACADVGVEGSDTEAKDQGKVFGIPANPVIATSTYDNECYLGAASIALSAHRRQPPTHP